MSLKDCLKQCVRHGFFKPWNPVLATQLRQEISALQPLTVDKAHSASTEEWIGNRLRLRELIMTNNPTHFLTWDVIGKTMFVGDSPYVATELTALRNANDWRTRWKPAIREDSAGAPKRFRGYLASSGNLIHHAYTLYYFERHLKRAIDGFQGIIEFGGGYGSFCRLVRKLGFRRQYIIFDLPEFSALQRYFLTSVGVPVDVSNNVRCVSDFDRLKANLAPGSDWLCVALWSLSETSLDFRRQFLDNVSAVTSWLIAYQGRFGEVDNVEFFADWTQRKSDFSWHSKEIPQLPGNYYLIGSRKQ